MIRASSGEFHKRYRKCADQKSSCELTLPILPPQATWGWSSRPGKLVLQQTLHCSELVTYAQLAPAATGAVFFIFYLVKNGHQRFMAHPVATVAFWLY